MRGLRERRRKWAAVAAAFALFFHTLVAGVVDGAMAGPRTIDPFGNLICTAHGAESFPDSSDKSGGRTSLPECCLVGCNIVGGKVATPPPAISVPLPEVTGSTSVSELAETLVESFERSPLNPRAPPSQA
jgi:hypothetical protein